MIAVRRFAPLKSGNSGRVQVAVLAGRQASEHGLKEHVVEREPRRPLVLRHGGTGEERLAVLVQVADLRLLQRSYAESSPVDDEVGQQVMTGQHGGDGLDVGGERDDEVGLALVRQLDSLDRGPGSVDRVVVVDHR